MGSREESCHRLIETLVETIEKLQRGKEECAELDWDLISPDDIDEIIEKVQDIVDQLKLELEE
ncbi:MAG: hypothetical protein JXB23_08685 [Candidatus Aminicenantes bacterium]|nr:hypothetical protein [Candidatus Aminicenantes bacterium]